MPFDDFLIRLQRQEERRYADRKHADQRYLRRLQRISDHKGHREQGQQEGKNILHQEQAGRALDIVDHASSLQHHGWHACKIRLQKHYLGRLDGRIASRCHGHAAVRILQG